MFDHETCSHPIRWYSEDVLYFVQILRKSSFQETLFNHFLRHAFATRLISVLSTCNSGMSSICCTNCSLTVLLGFLFIVITSFCGRQVNLRISIFSWVLHLSRRIFTFLRALYASTLPPIGESNQINLILGFFETRFSGGKSHLFCTFLIVSSGIVKGIGSSGI